jgi:hypothetical protein
MADKIEISLIFLKEGYILKAKKIIIIFFSIMVSLTMFSICLSPIEAQTDLPPEPYFTSPSNDEFMSTLDPGLIKVYEKQVEVRVVDLTDEDDITHALFEYSYDGLDWFLLEEDYNKGFEGIQFTGDYGKASTNGLGGTGWNTIWNTDTLMEGHYFLRATLFDQSAQEGTTEIMVHYDPTPPFLNLDQEPTINEGILGPLSGTVSFNASTMDEDPAYFSLEYISASRADVDQQGLGNANQENVGTPDTKGTPQTDDDVNNFCGPTSAANALWRLAQNDPALLNNTSGSQYNNATQMAEQLGNDTKTDPVNGTATNDLTAGLRKYLKDRNLDGNYTVKPHIPKAGGRGPTWNRVYDALRQGEAVILLKVRPGTDGIVGTSDDIGHYEAGKDAKPYPRGGGEVSVRDPKGPTDKSGKVKVVPNNNGFEGIWFDENGDGEKDEKEVWYLLAFWEISPNNRYTWELQKVEYTHLGEDLTPSDGFTIPVETQQIHDGFYLLKGTMHDTTGNVGMNRTTIYVNNHPPTPITLEPHNVEEVTANSINLHWSQNQDEDFTSYQIFISETEGTLGNNVQNITDWITTSTTITNLESETTYYFTIRVTDYSDQKTDSNQIQAPATLIPEFSSPIILFLLLLTTLIILFYKKKITNKPNYSTMQPNSSTHKCT